MPSDWFGSVSDKGCTDSTLNLRCWYAGSLAWENHSQKKVYCRCFRPSDLIAGLCDVGPVPLRRPGFFQTLRAM